MRCPVRFSVRCGYRRSTRLLFVTLMGVACLSVTLLLQRIEPATLYFLKGHYHAQAYMANLPPVFNRHYDFGQFDATDNLQKVGQSDTADSLPGLGLNVGERVKGQPNVGEPVQGQPNVGEPVKGQPKVGEPVQGQPKVGEPVQGQPKVGEPVQGQLNVGEPAKDQPKVGEPVKDQPKVGEPVQDKPKVEEPVKGQPKVGKTVKGQTKVGEPVQGQPNVGKPAKGQHEVGEPVNGQPKVGKPVQGQPKVGEPVKGQPKVGEPVQGQLKVGEPAKDQPKAGKPAKGQPKVGEPVQGQPKVGKPAKGQPKMGKPVQGQPNVGDPVKGQLKVGEPVKGQPNVGDPVKGQPKVGEPVKGQPKVGEPVKDQPKVGEPVKGQPKAGEPVKGQLQVEMPVKGELQVVVPVKGGLGNRMFQYASLLGIAHMNNRTPVYNTSSGLNKTFHVTHLHHNRSGHFKVMSERHFASYDPKLERLPEVNVQCMQYLQSWKYFHFMQADIRREFTFTQPVKDAVAELLHKHSKVMAGKVKVGVHVRGGDLLVEQQIKRGYHVAPLSYVRKAMDFMRHKHGDVIFIFVTQNPGYCREEFNCTECVVADTAPAEVHLGVLASCDHVIMTVGTYGWWGGYLSGGDVVYWWDPKESLHNPPLPVEIRNPQDYYLPSWTPLTG